MRNNPPFPLLSQLLTLKEDACPVIDETIRTELRDQYNGFAEYVWNNSFHDKEMVRPEATKPVSIPETVEACKLAIQDSYNRIRKGLDALEVYGNESFNLVYHDNKIIRKGNIATSFPDIQSLFEEGQVGEAMKLCYQYTEMLAEFIWKAMEATSESLATSTRAEEEARKETENELPKEYYLGANLTEEQLSMLYTRLEEKRWLDRSCTEDEFVFYFSGIGAQPKQKLKWRETCVLLTAFLDNVVDDNRVWAKTERVFEVFSNKEMRFVPIDRKNIKAVYCSGQLTEAWRIKHYPAVKELFVGI